MEMIDFFLTLTRQLFETFQQYLWCTGSWETKILNGTKKNCKKCQFGEVPVGEVPVGGSASWGKCQLGDKGQLGDKI